MAVQCPFCGAEMEYLTVGQASKLLNRPVKTIRDQIRRGWFPGTQRVEGQGAMNTRWAYRIPITAILPLLAEGDEGNVRD